MTFSMYNSIEEVISQVKNSDYIQVSELLNTTNENLFIGPNNLLNSDKIEIAKIYTHLIYSKDTVERLYDENDQRSWIKSNEIPIVTDKGSDEKHSISNHMIGIFILGRNLTSHEHIVHGGAIATLIDEYFVKVVLPLTPNHFAVTANLNIRYLKPIKFGESDDKIPVLLHCFIKEEQNGKFKVIGSLCNLSGEKYCVGELLAVVPKNPL